jgi:hypothetical protein
MLAKSDETIALLRLNSQVWPKGIISQLHIKVKADNYPVLRHAAFRLGWVEGFHGCPDFGPSVLPMVYDRPSAI